MHLPTIHDNGTSKQQLQAEYENASGALEEAYQVLKRTAPNLRNYYIQDPTFFAMALLEHMQRLQRLDSIKEEIDAITTALDHA